VEPSNTAPPKVKMPELSGQSAGVVVVPGPVWHDGWVKLDETPPPPDPYLSFHTVSVEPLPNSDREVPPTPVTVGWLAGSSTSRPVWPSKLQS